MDEDKQEPRKVNYILAKQALVQYSIFLNKERTSFHFFLMKSTLNCEKRDVAYALKLSFLPSDPSLLSPPLIFDILRNIDTALEFDGTLEVSDYRYENNK